MIELSVYSVIMALMWSSLYIVVLYICRKREKFVHLFGVSSLLTLLIMTVVRLIVSFEFPFARVLPSEVIYPAIVNFFNLEIIDINGKKLKLYTVLIFVWITVALIKIFRMLVHYYSFSLKVRHIPRCNDSKVLDIIKEITPKHEKVKIIQNKIVKSPFMFGLIHPVIFLPNIELSDSDLHNILLHEYTHFESRDNWGKLAIELFCALFWWNPLSYLLKYELDSTLEIKCDLRVTKNMDSSEKKAYLQSIIKIMEQDDDETIKPPVLSTAFSNNKNKEIIRQRFHLVLDYSGKKNRFYEIIFTLITLATFLISYLYIVQPHFMPEYESFEYGNVENDGMNSPDEGIEYLNSKNTYILARKDGTYSIYFDGEWFEDIDEDVKRDLVLSGIKIIEEGDNEEQ